jgi:hypothetical protein
LALPSTAHLPAIDAIGQSAEEAGDPFKTNSSQVSITVALDNMSSTNFIGDAVDDNAEKTAKTMDAITSKYEQMCADIEMTEKDNAACQILDAESGKCLSQNDHLVVSNMGRQSDGSDDVRPKEDGAHEALRPKHCLPRNTINFGSDDPSLDAESDDELVKDLEKIMMDMSEDDAATTENNNSISQNDQLSDLNGNGRTGTGDTWSAFDSEREHARHCRPSTLRERIAARMSSTSVATPPCGYLLAPKDIIQSERERRRPPSVGGA